MASKMLNLDRLNRKLARMPAEAKKEIRRALDQGGDEIVASAKTLAAKSSGTLANTIQKRDGRYELEVEVVAGGEATTKAVRQGSDAEYDYAFGNELGTKEMPKQPFLRPAYRLVAKRVNGRIKRAVNKAGKAEANGQ